MTDLRLTRVFDAPRDQVFAAWTDPEVLKEWWAADPTWDAPVAEIDLRAGGTYRLSMRDTTTGAVHTVGGEYRDVEPPERLVYTWTWEGAPVEMTGSAGTLVVVEFREAGERTEVVLTHTGFATEHIRDQHVQGWTGCLDNLERRVFPRRTESG